MEESDVYKYETRKLSIFKISDQKHNKIWELYLHLDEDELKRVFDFGKKYNMKIDDITLKLECIGHDFPDDFYQDFRNLLIPNIKYESQIIYKTNEYTFTLYLKRNEYGGNLGYDRLVYSRLLKREWFDYVSTKQWIKIKELL